MKRMDEILLDVEATRDGNIIRLCEHLFSRNGLLQISSTDYKRVIVKVDGNTVVDEYILLLDGRARGILDFKRYFYIDLSTLKKLDNCQITVIQELDLTICGKKYDKISKTVVFQDNYSKC